MTTEHPQCRKTNVNTIKKSPVLRQLMGADEDFETLKQLEQDGLPETSPLHGFQVEDNCASSSDNTSLTHKKRKKTPNYRIIDKYSKSKKQYWKERNRRKLACQLSSEGYTYTQIAKKLGVSEKTVQRDIKKVSRYYMGQFNKACRIMQQEKMRKWQEQLNGLSQTQQFKVMTKLLCEAMDRKREREYNRHLFKIILDMDNLKYDVFPTLIPWPDRESVTMTFPMHIRFFLRVEGKDLPYGGFTIGGKS